MLGRLEVLGPGAGAARGRRRQAAQLERQWGLEQRVADLARRQGWRAYRSGYSKFDLMEIFCHNIFLSAGNINSFIEIYQFQL